jgi:hypothetical protein
MITHSHRIRVAFAATTLGTALALAASTASTASTTSLTATAIRITDHPAYVQAEIDFTPAGLAARQIEATDPAPADGAARLSISAAHAATQVSTRRGDGIRVRLAVVPGGLSVRLTSTIGTVKYLSYTVMGNRLTIALWKSTFRPAGNVARGAGACLTLRSAAATPGTVTARGRANGLFENTFRAIVRDGTGRVLASRSVSATRGWHVTLHYAAAQAQGGSFEAAAASAKDGALSCLVQKVLTLPASNPRANLHVAYRARADVNGDGRSDLVTLRRRAMAGRLTVSLAGGASLSATTPSDATWLPGLVAFGNVDGRAGDELFVDVTHVTTAESIAIYTDWHGAIVRAGTLSAYGSDYGIVYGVSCSAAGTRHFVTEHAFTMSFATHRWTRQDTVYVWQGPKLVPFARPPATRLSAPPVTQVGVQCGQTP